MDIKVSSEDLSAFIRALPQIVPESWCMKCKICCRFPDTVDVQTPAWSSLESEWAKKTGGSVSWFQPMEGSPSLGPKLQPCGHGFRCPAFHEESNGCTIYSVRPLDCRLYPFVLTTDASSSKVVLSMDTKCPYIQEHGSDLQTLAYAQELARYLETPVGVEYLKQNPHIIGPSWPEFVTMAALPTLTSAVQEPVKSPHPSLKRLTFEHKELLQEFCARFPHAFSGYTLAGILGWSDLIHFWWMEVRGCFCLFAEQAGGLFMPIPPLGTPVHPEVLQTVWKILAEANQGSAVSRIEGIEPADAAAYAAAGFALAEGEPEYLYLRSDLADLRGDRFRSQRWAVNHCVRQIKEWRFRPFEAEDIVACLQLYTAWGIHRQQSAQEPFAKALIRDGLFFHRRFMMSCQELGLTGRVLEAQGRIVGYTFGAPVSSDILCVFLEIADRSIQGTAQLLFREFCRETDRYKWINAMGDCGIPGLRRAKEAYRPSGSIRTAVATHHPSTLRQA